MGEIFSGGSRRQISSEEMRVLGGLQQTLAQIPVPTLHHRDNPHEHLFFAFHDGTGQDYTKSKLGLPTTAARLYEQAQILEDDPSNRIAAGYAEGIGSQSFAPARWFDGALAMTWADGIEKLYTEFAKQAKEWIDADPEAKIRVAGAGYSRGAVQLVGFQRLVDQYGIADPHDLSFGRDAHGNITVESKLPPLAPPGQVAQVSLLLDSVATGMPHNFDARLPGSSISRVSTLASTEQRELFWHQAINDLGIAEDGHAINIPTPGGHSNIGGGNRESGVEILVGNAATDYLNLLSDRPLFEKRPVPTELSQMTIYQAEGATAAWGLAMDRDGQRNIREELANCKIVDPCRDSEPVNKELAGQFEYRHIQLDPVEQAQIRALLEKVRQAEETRQQAPVESGRNAPENPSMEPQTVTPPIPTHLQDFRDPEHPQHGRYQGVLREVHRMEVAHGIASGPHSERMAAAWVDRFSHEDRRFDIERFEMRGQDVVALPRRDNYFEAQGELSLNANLALARPVGQVSADWARRVMPHLGQPQTIDPFGMANHDLRHPDQVRSGPNETLRGQLADTYARAGILRSDAQLDRATAAVALDLQRHGLDRADHLYLLPNRDGSIGPDSGIGVLQGQHPLQLHSQTSHEAMQQAPEESYRQLAQVMQQRAIEQQQHAMAARQQPVMG